MKPREATWEPTRNPIRPDRQLVLTELAYGKVHNEQWLVLLASNGKLYRVWFKDLATLETDADTRWEGYAA